MIVLLLIADQDLGVFPLLILSFLVQISRESSRRCIYAVESRGFSFFLVSRARSLHFVRTESRAFEGSSTTYIHTCPMEIQPPVSIIFQH